MTAVNAQQSHLGTCVACRMRRSMLPLGCKLPAGLLGAIELAAMPAAINGVPLRPLDAAGEAAWSMRARLADRSGTVASCTGVWARMGCHVGGCSGPAAACWAGPGF